MNEERMAPCSCLMVVSPCDDPIELSAALRSIGIEQRLAAAEYVFVLNGQLTSATHNSIEHFTAAAIGAVKVVKTATTKTLSEALNLGLNHCTQELVARMDPDDVSHPDRFQRQAEVFTVNREISILGSWIAEFRELDGTHRVRKFPQGHDDISKLARFRNPLAHPAVMFRRRAIEELGGYPLVDKAQDYLLWSRAIAQGYKIGNVQEVLLNFRVNSKLLARRDITYLKSEKAIAQLMRRDGFLNIHQYYLIILSKSILRLIPLIIRKVLYRIRS